MNGGKRRWEPSKWVEYGTTEDKYSWTQTPEEVTVTINLPDKSLHGRDIEVVMKMQHLRVALKSKPDEPFVDGKLSKAIDVDDSTWTLVDGVVEVTLAKGPDSCGDEEGKWWSCVIEGHKEIDTKAIESTRFLDDSLLRRIWEEKHKPEDPAAKKQEELAAASAAADEANV